MKDSEIMLAALESGFMVSTQYGQEIPKLMPISDMGTLKKFAELLEEIIDREE